MSNHSRGFTLVELVVTLLVAMILAATALPNMRQLIQSNRLKTASNELVNAIYMARGEAVKRRVTVNVCPSTDGQSCDTSVTSWIKGYVVYTGTTPTATSRIRGETLISASEARTPTATGSTLVTFTSGGTASASTFDLCVSNLSSAKRIQIGTTGRPYVATLNASSSCSAT